RGSTTGTAGTANTGGGGGGAGDQASGAGGSGIVIVRYVAPATSFQGSVGVGTTTPSYMLDIQGGQINSSGGLCIADDCRKTWNDIVDSGGWRLPSTYNIKGAVSNGGKTWSPATTTAEYGYSAVVYNKTFGAGEDFSVVAYWAHDYRGIGMVYGPRVSHLDYNGYAPDALGPYWGALNTSGFPNGYSGTFFGQYHAPISGGGAATTGYWFKWARAGNVLSLQYASTSATGPWTNIKDDVTIASTDKVAIGIGEAGSSEVSPLTLASPTTGNVSSPWTTTGPYVYSNIGNVGIGTTTPGALLDIESAVGVDTQLRLGRVNSAGYYDIGRANSTTGFLVFNGVQSGYGGFQFKNTTAGNILTIIDSGNVGIGTTTPGNKFDVSGNVGMTGYLKVTNLIDSGGIIGADAAAGSYTRLALNAENGPGGVTTASNVGGWIGVDSRSNQPPIQIYVKPASGSDTVAMTITSAGIVRMFAYGAGTATFDASGNISSASDIRLKDVQGSFSKGLDALAGLSPILYKWRPESGMDATSTYAGFSAQNVQQFIPEAVGQNRDGYLSLQDRSILAVLVNGVNELNARTSFISNFSTSTALTVDASGNVGIGTTTPQHRLSVSGDVAAESFVNNSTRGVKTDITGLATTTEDSILEQLATTNVYSYRYKDESADNPLRIGLITDSAPTEVLSVSGDGVDIYKLAVFTLAGVKAQSRQIDELNLNLESIASSTGETGGDTSQGGVTSDSAASDSQSFAERFFSNIFARITQWLADAANGVGDVLARTFRAKDQLCINNTCVNEEQLKALLAGAAASTGGVSDSGGDTSQGGVTSGAGNTGQASTGAVPTISINGKADASVGSPTSTSVGATPIISINGNNPATINVGDTYGDLGALITGPTEADKNLGIHTFLDGVAVDSINLDTSTAGEHTIDYVATNSFGTATSTRTVIISAPPVPSSDGG
ncbi:tail fiber domain-containing protein, partial [Candidatus Uhrbacteria bacterium]|nr:tail fiber domain-containing protein [Candidatus Uhrbacteria bacterium]